MSKRVMGSAPMNGVSGALHSAILSCVVALLPFQVLAGSKDECASRIVAQITVDHGHPWRPPFGLDRIGVSPVAHVEVASAQRPPGEYYVAAYRNGREVERRSLSLAPNPSDGSWGQAKPDASVFFGRAQLEGIPDEVALLTTCGREGKLRQLTRQAVLWPEIEAAVEARPHRQINPLDLGAILVPHDWLLLAAGQKALIEIAAISHQRELPLARVRAWFADEKPLDIPFPLVRNARLVKQLELPLAAQGESTTLHVTLTDGMREVWKKEIHTMVVAQAPHFPRFGAVETKLRYDAPIAVNGETVEYDSVWDPKLSDVVVFLPNGSRFVFWRWFHYAPFWAGLYNTGFNYEWAENLTHPFQHPNGTTNFPEPLFDNELRYGRVHIVESTSSRVHVRWTYQGTDPSHRLWGEQAVEDFYFYPDGFGTRVLTLSSVPDAHYEISEFIILTPLSAYPFEVLPDKMIDMLYMDGEKRTVVFPNLDENRKRNSELHFELPDLRKAPALYRIFHDRRDPAAALYFNPRHVPKTVYTYQHRYDRGEVITPALGGAGETGPGMSCLVTTIADLPEPLSVSVFPMPDTLGQSRKMMIRKWAWLIAKSDAPDEALLDWMHSFGEPPSLKVTGARIDFPSYSPERRAMRIVVESPVINIRVKPALTTVNPVFELAQASKGRASVKINGKLLPVEDYAWDGATLWMKASIDSQGATISVDFR